MIYSIPPRNQKGKECCAFWDDFLSKENIDQILALSEWVNMGQGMVGGQSSEETSIENNLNIRSSKVQWIYPDHRTENIYETLSNVVAEVNRQFFHFDITGMYEPLQLTLYRADEQIDDHYTWHTDMSMYDSKTPRKLSMSLLLSDPSEFEGGELQIKTDSDNEITLEQKQGRAWFFPSWILHRVTPVTRGIRRSLVVWIGGPPFK